MSIKIKHGQYNACDTWHFNSLSFLAYVTSLLLYTVHTWAAIFLEHLANLFVRVSSWEPTEPLAGSLLHVSLLFVFAHPVSCCLSHLFMFHTCTLPCQSDSYATSHIQQSYCTYLPHIHITIHSLLHTFSTLLGRPAGPNPSCQEQLSLEPVFPRRCHFPFFIQWKPS
jgi:hypothetical protein